MLYSSTALSGIIPDQQNGYGTLFFAIAGLQNGAPDGIALVKPDNSVVLFLSYEGSFTATDGPAIGLTSTDIGVLEAGTEALGLSLQLSGAGYVYEQFAWQGPISSTSNLINLNQTFGEIVNEPITFTCPSGITTFPGITASEIFSATDADGTVIDASITNGGTAGISIIDLVPATEVGGELTGTLDVADTVVGGTYDVEITFSNDDTPDAQTAACTVPVTVVPLTCPVVDSHQIGEVQGETDTSPVNGSSVTVSGIVVGDFKPHLVDFTSRTLTGTRMPLLQTGYLFTTLHTRFQSATLSKSRQLSVNIMV